MREDLSFKGSHDLANRPLYGSTVLILSPTLEECATGIQLDEKTVLTTAHAFRGLSHSECVVVSGNPIRVITSGETVDLEKTIEGLSPTQWSHFDAVDSQQLSLNLL